jgi:hypothetical protein
MIRGIQIYIKKTRLDPKILQHPLMALRPVMPLRTIVDQILMECWKERSLLCVKIMIAIVAKICIKREREHVVNPQKHSNHVDYYAFTTTGV